MPVNKMKKATYFFLYLAVLTAVISCVQYDVGSARRSLLLSKLSPEGRELYVEKTYKYPPVYQYAEWLDERLPYGAIYGLYAPGINYMYYYSRLNYFLWPKYIYADVKVVARINDGDLSALKDLRYGGTVFSPALKPAFRQMTINGRKYFLSGRFDGQGCLLMGEAKW